MTMLRDRLDKLPDEGHADGRRELPSLARLAGSGLHLARMFTDYEPGIHWSQVQMQSGTTGINTPRIYNPVKQSMDQDPEGIFIRRWLPALADVRLPLIHTPWLLSPLEQHDLGVVIGRDYPAPIVDHMEAARAALQDLVGAEWARILGGGGRDQRVHGSRRSGMPMTGSRRRTPKPAARGLQPARCPWRSRRGENAPKTGSPDKICPACGRPFTWRRKWAVWDQVQWCSDRCRRNRRVTHTAQADRGKAG